MAEKYTAGAYWGPRRETVDECAGRLRSYLGGLGAAHPALASWYRKTGVAGTAVSGDTAEPDLRDLLLEGRNRRDADGTVIDELGYQIGLWNRATTLATALSGVCGGYSEAAGLLNSAVLSLPVEDAPDPELVRVDVMRAVLDAMVHAWDPDWATFVSRSGRSAQRSLPAPVVGVLTYAGPGFLVDRDALPARVSISPLGAGSLIAFSDLVAVTPDDLDTVRKAIRGPA